MKINLDDMTLNDQYTLERLRGFLSKMECYARFDPSQMVQVYVNDSNDFTAVESVSYQWSFTSQKHKLIETIKSNKSVDPVPYSEFRLALNRL